MDSWWSVASALKDAVKQQTAEITASLQNTDWKTEINALQEGLKEDTVEISQKAKEVTEELGQRTMHVAKNLPQVVDEGRRKAVAQLEHLPGSGAARAKEAAAHLQQAGASLSQMGHRVALNTSEMFDHFSNAIQAEMNAVQDRDLNTNTFRGGGASSSRSLHRGNESTKFSRFDADVASMQRDSSTYCDEPDDNEDFETWVAVFDLPSRKPDIAKILSENTFMSELQTRIVPVVVDYESFWTRYFYRLHKLEERHAKVAALASRTAQMEEDDLGWGTDEEEEEEEELELEAEKESNTEISVQGDEGEEDEAEPAVAEAAAGALDTADVESNTGEEDVGGAEVEPNSAEVDESKPLAAPTAEEGEEDKEVHAEATDGTEKEIKEKAPAIATGKKKKMVATKEDIIDAAVDKDDDDFSSLDFSGAEDIPEGEDGGGDSDWNDDDVAEWE
ncbi:putative BSD domain-containing protein 1 [Nannochloris sp. 'desiccata']|nr:putative BSD domain-containing protein 1 [Chlorella desiccata (nom. nud.)]